MNPQRYHCTIAGIEDDLRSREAIVVTPETPLEDLAAWGAEVDVISAGLRVFFPRWFGGGTCPAPYGWYLVRRLDGAADLFFPAEPEWFERTHEVVL